MNDFFRLVYSHPGLLWKLVASLMFFSLAIALAAVPSLTYGLEGNARYTFSALLLFYALFRAFTFYSDFKRIREEDL